MDSLEMNADAQYTLILGAEGELGKALAREVARKGCNLIVVSTTNLDLQRFAIGLQLKEDVQVEALKIDLAEQETINTFVEAMRSRYDIRAMINNVICDWSVAHNKCISEIAREDFLTRFRGAAQVIMGLLPQLKKFSASYIQHVIPFPQEKDQFCEALQASVGKMYAFAKELEEELKDTSISLSMLHSNPVMNTAPEFEVFDGLSGEIKNLTPRLVAVKAINGMLRGDRLIIPGFRNKVRYFLSRQAHSWLRSSVDSLETSLHTVHSTQYSGSSAQFSVDSTQ
ncbi:MAG: SDR family NAD(P)-dependent oxidoreductase [Bacteroidetes bacterium]|nr:SDR family NAD(P)-dependent oxidoreductase [Bacteroidota bacterium]